MTTAITSNDFGLFFPECPRNIPSLLDIASKYVHDSPTLDIDTADVPQELRELVKADSPTAKNIVDVAACIIRHGHTGAFDHIVATWAHTDANTQGFDDKRYNIAKRTLQQLGRCGHMAAINAVMVRVKSYDDACLGMYAEAALYGAAQGRHLHVFDTICNQYVICETVVYRTLGGTNWSEAFWHRRAIKTTPLDYAHYFYGLVNYNHTQAAIDWFKDHSTDMTVDERTLSCTLKSGSYCVFDYLFDVIPRPFKAFSQLGPLPASFHCYKYSVDDFVEYILYLRAKLVAFMAGASAEKQQHARGFWVMSLRGLLSDLKGRYVSGNCSGNLEHLCQCLDAAVKAWMDDVTMADIMAMSVIWPSNMMVVAERLV